MQAHINPREKTRYLWKNPCHDNSDTHKLLVGQSSKILRVQATQRADTTIEAASEHARIHCPAVMKQRWQAHQYK